MGKKLAIRGHSARGKEVIELLEMMGGKNIHKHDGGSNSYSYYLYDHAILHDRLSVAEDDDFEIFTLEGFLEKYPFKVGDKVLIPEYESEVRICEIQWDGFEIQYKVYRNDEAEWYTAGELLEYNDNPNKTKPLFKPGDVVKLKGCPNKNLFWIVMVVVKDGYIFNDGKKYSFDDQHHYEKSDREVINPMKNVLAELLEHIKTTSKEDLEREFEEIKEWSNVGPTVEEFMDFCNKVNTKPKYPATYGECKEVMQLQDSIVQARCGYEWRFIGYFQQLLMCRDAYWKIAGEQMGLGRRWEPDWTNENQLKYGLYNELKYSIINPSQFVFPTEEMRDAFYENFKELIEQCK